MLFRRSQNKNKPGNNARRARTGPSIITDEVVIDGNLITGGELQIDGTVNGDVRARAAVIDANGIIHGEVAAEEVVVRGRIIGLIRGINVHIFAGGHVQGDIINESISIENGAFIDGKICRSDDPLAEMVHQDYAEDHGRQPQPQPGFSVIDEDGFRPAALPGPRNRSAAE